MRRPILTGLLVMLTALLPAAADVDPTTPGALLVTEPGGAIV